jgi:hypothetical protein
MSGPGVIASSRATPQNATSVLSNIGTDRA